MGKICLILNLTSLVASDDFYHYKNISLCLLTMYSKAYCYLSGQLFFFDLKGYLQPCLSYVEHSFVCICFNYAYDNFWNRRVLILVILLQNILTINTYV